MTSHLITIALATAVLSGCSSQRPETHAPLQQDNRWYQQGQALLQQKQRQQPITSAAKNVILFIADGHGVTSNTALRILDGQRQGMSGEEHVLSYEQFPHLALAKTYNTNAQVPDSAGTASAMLTGIKTRAGVLAVDASVERGDCTAARRHQASTALELAEQIGMATGVVTTTRITHATPAAAYAHSADRRFENDTELSPTQRQQGCLDIARQLVEFNHGDGIEVMMGGGRRNFLPDTRKDAEGRRGIRGDSRDLTREWRQRYPDGQFVQTLSELSQASPEGKLLALFSPSHMAYEVDRKHDEGGEPSLAQMTETAITRLQQHSNGFFLLVEAGRVDHGHHAGNAHKALEEGRAYAAAVARAMAMTDEQDTLIIATADHSHTLTLAGYSSRGNPILGLAGYRDSEGELRPIKAQDKQPYTTLSYANGPGAGTDRRQLTDKEVRHVDFLQPSLTPLASETHGGEDVAIYARGPGAWLFSGTVEQNYIFHVMHHAARLQQSR